MPRKIEEQVVTKIRERGDVGEKKYGVTLDRKDLTPKEWLKHAQEEMLDGAQYLERCIEAEDMLEEAMGIIQGFCAGFTIKNEQHVMLAFLKRYEERFDSLSK